MKRKLTFKLKNIYVDYKSKMNKELSDRIDMRFKLIGDIAVGKTLCLYFEDGFKFETKELDLQGYIKKTIDNKEVFVTLCTKDMYYEMDVVDEKINVPIVEQLQMDNI